MLNWSSTSLPCQGERKVLDISWNQVSSWQSMTGSLLSGTRAILFHCLIFILLDISDILEYTPILPPPAEFAQLCWSKDCIFYSDHWTLLREGKGSSAGSDHKPVYAPCQKWSGRQPWQFILGGFEVSVGGEPRLAPHRLTAAYSMRCVSYASHHIPSQEFSYICSLF